MAGRGGVRPGRQAGGRKPAPTKSARAPEDHQVESIVDQWRAERPDLDPTPMLIFGRVARVHTLVRLAQNAIFSDYDLSFAAFDVLANLRRSGPPHRKAASSLASSSMISTGGITFRMDLLENAGLIDRVRDSDDRRVVYAQLTDKGRTVIDEAIGVHLDLEHRMLTRLNKKDRAELTRLLALLEDNVTEATANPDGA